MMVAVTANIAVLLAAPPISGSLPEEHFGRAGGARAWVRFSPTDGEDWAGDFRADGLTPRYGACVFADGRTVLVIAGGRGYVLDARTHRLLQTVRDDLWNAAAVPDHPFVVAHNETMLFAYGREGELWRSERIALDGIRIDEVTASGLQGRVYLPHAPSYDDDQWKHFRLTFIGWKYEGPTRRGR
jgi:hypothetical protein